MKKIISIFLFLATALALPLACSKNNNPITPAATSTPVPSATNWDGYTNTPSPTPTPTTTACVNASGTPCTSTFTTTATPTATGPTLTPTNTTTYTPTVTATNTNTAYPTAAPNFIENGPGVQYPNGVAYNSSTGYLYVAEGDGPGTQNEVQIFNASSLAGVTTLTVYGSTSFSDPYGVAVNNAGTTFYVLDQGSVLEGGQDPSTIYVFTSAGAPVTNWSSWTPSSGVTAFNGPEGIAVTTIASTDYIYVADTNNNTVEEFTFNGTAISPVTQWSTGHTGFSIPSAVALDDSNNVYVADAGNNLVQIYNGSSWNSWSTTSSYFTNTDIWGIAVDGSGNVYTADTYNNQVEIFNNTGTLETAWNGPSAGSTFVSPDGIAFGSGGNIWVSDFENGSSDMGSLTEFTP